MSSLGEEEEASGVAPEQKTTPKRDTWITIDTKTKSPVEHSSTARLVSLLYTHTYICTLVIATQKQYSDIVSTAVVESSNTTTVLAVSVGRQLLNAATL